MKPRVVVGLSGGVDSAVAALLLAQGGAEVVGVTLLLHGGPEEEHALARARAVADELGIEHRVADARGRFAREVVEPFLRGHARGLTPNPCARCNPFVKLPALLEAAGRVGADAVATGHYLRRRGERVLRARDRAKDQSYFLWRVPREVMGRALFPLGELTKPEVRALAERAGLSAARAPESQNLCFAREGAGEFLARRLAPRPGPVVEAATGEVVGRHRGAELYTVGQGRGLGLFKSHRKLYVVATDPGTNTVYVGPREAVLSRGLFARDPNYLLPPGDWPERVSVQVRHRSQPVPARVLRADAGGLEVEFLEPVFAVTPGQSAVVYDGEVLLGGGEISAARGARPETPAPAGEPRRAPGRPTTPGGP